MADKVYLNRLVQCKAIFEKNQTKNFGHFSAEKVGLQGESQYEMVTPDGTVVNYMNHFSRNGNVDLNILFRSIAKHKFQRKRESFSAALLTICLRAYWEAYLWCYALIIDEFNQEDFVIGRIESSNNEGMIIPFQEVVIPNIFMGTSSEERINRGVLIVSDKLHRYAPSPTPVNLLAFSQVSYSTDERHQMYRQLKDQIGKQNVFTEVWFLFFNGIVKNDVELSAEQVQSDGTVRVFPVLLKKELDRYAVLNSDI